MGCIVAISFKNASGPGFSVSSMGMQNHAAAMASWFYMTSEKKTGKPQTRTVLLFTYLSVPIIG